MIKKKIKVFCLYAYFHYKNVYSSIACNTVIQVVCFINHIMPLLIFYTPWKYQKNLWFSNTVWIFQIWSFFWSVFFLIRSEYEEIIRISPYSVRMRENTDQKKLRSWTLLTQCDVSRGYKKRSVGWNRSLVFY